MGNSPRTAAAVAGVIGPRAAGGNKRALPSNRMVPVNVRLTRRQIERVTEYQVEHDGKSLAQCYRDLLNVGLRELAPTSPAGGMRISTSPATAAARAA